MRRGKRFLEKDNLFIYVGTAIFFILAIALGIIMYMTSRTANKIKNESGQVVQESKVDETVENTEKADEPAETPATAGVIHIEVNGEPIALAGKSDYIFVDVFNVYPFDLSASRGRSVMTKVNGRKAQFAEPLQDGDRVEISWKEN